MLSCTSRLLEHSPSIAPAVRAGQSPGPVQGTHVAAQPCPEGPGILGSWDVLDIPHLRGPSHTRARAGRHPPALAELPSLCKGTGKEKKELRDSREAGAERWRGV